MCNIRTADEPLSFWHGFFYKNSVRRSAQQNVASFLLPFFILLKYIKGCITAGQKNMFYPRTFFWHHVCDVANLKNAREALPLKMAQAGFVFFFK